MLFAVSAVCFAACNDNDDDDEEVTSAITSITADVENGSAYSELIDTVKAEIEYDLEGVRIPHTLASAPYGNGKFTINLPANIDDRYLVSGRFDDGISTVSDPEVRSAIVLLLNTYKSGDYTSNVYYATNHNILKPSNTFSFASFLYADRDVIIKASHSEKDEEWTENANIHLILKRGWNIMYTTNVRSDESRVVTQTVTNRRPDGMKWYSSHSLLQ